MFQSARTKLTLWYLAIIILISASFSVVIYKVLSNEVERFARTQRMRIERGIFYRDFNPNDPDTLMLPPTVVTFDMGLVEETKRHLIFTLLIVNGSILIAAGGLSYLLAGRTLEPIQKMMDEQHRFISDASHELKTPLTSLKSGFEVYLRNPQRKRSDADEVISESIEEVDKLQSLSESMLQLALYQHTSGKVPMETISSKKLIEKAIKHIKPMATQKGITIEAELPEATVRANADSLAQLLVILLDNAVKYSPSQSSIQVSSSLEKAYLRIHVTDQGIGIAKADLPHIFDRFYRADQARSKEHASGYGLGLSIAQQLAKLHQTKLTVTSELGKGSSFAFRLPLASAS